MREFLYGLVIGAALMWGYETYDIPGQIAYLNSASDYAAKSTSGYK